MVVSSGIHHITAITRDPQKNIDFYEGFLGQRLVKRTVNFDDPNSYHFYFGDAYGQPGTLLTFFYWPQLPPGIPGLGEVSAISYAVPAHAKEYWVARALEYHIYCAESTNLFGEDVLILRDPDDLKIELVLVHEKPPVDAWAEGGIGEEHELRGFHAATLTVLNTEEMRPMLEALGYTETHTAGDFMRFSTEGDRARLIDVFEAPDLSEARQGAGSVHHIAFRAATDADELALRERVMQVGAHPTPVIDRQYFRSVYFRTPGGVLFEIATDPPGFAIDEPAESLGERLTLPPQYEPFRDDIEQILVPVTLPREHYAHH